RPDRLAVRGLRTFGRVPRRCATRSRPLITLVGLVLAGVGGVHLHARTVRIGTGLDQRAPHRSRPHVAAAAIPAATAGTVAAAADGDRATAVAGDHTDRGLTLDLDVEMEQVADDLLLEGLLHLVVHRAALALILNQRILLGHRPQPDA